MGGKGRREKRGGGKGRMGGEGREREGRRREERREVDASFAHTCTSTGAETRRVKEGDSM